MTTAPSVPGPPFETTTASGEASVDEAALLTEVRLGRHPRYDRIVFEFRNGTPGYRAGYVEPPIREDGSGRRVELEGDAYLEIRMEPGSGFDLSGQGEETFTGPTRIDADRAGLENVQELVRTGDFEAVLAWVADADEDAPFRVQSFEGPPRIVDDVRND